MSSTQRVQRKETSDLQPEQLQTAPTVVSAPQQDVHPVASRRSSRTAVRTRSTTPSSSTSCRATKRSRQTDGIAAPPQAESVADVTGETDQQQDHSVLASEQRTQQQKSMHADLAAATNDQACDQPEASRVAVDTMHRVPPPLLHRSMPHLPTASQRQTSLSAAPAPAADDSSRRLAVESLSSHPSASPQPSACWTFRKATFTSMNTVLKVFVREC